MRITTWNCQSGGALEKARDVDYLGSDVLALQECSRPAKPDDRLLWVAIGQTKGLGLVVAPGWTTEMASIVAGAPIALPAHVHGEMDLNALVCWTQPKKPYVAKAFEVLEAYAGLIRSGPTVVLGDFNSNSSLRDSPSHDDLVGHLEKEFDLISAYHHFTGEAQGSETRPTYFHQRKEDKPFHLDYCWLPRSLATRTTEVDVAGFGPLSKKSDHRPLTIGFATS